MGGNLLGVRSFCILALTSTAVSSLALVGCGKPPSATYAVAPAGPDACNPAYVTHYTALMVSLRTLGDVRELDAADKQVDEFATKYKGVVCSGDVSGNGKPETTFAPIDTNARTEELRKTLKGLRKADGPSETPPAPSTAAVSPVTQVSALSKGIVLEVTNAPLFNQLLKAGSRLVIQKGKVTAIDSRDPAVNACFIVVVGSSKTGKEGEQLTFEKFKEADLLLNGTSTDLSVILSCAKLDGSADSFKVSDLNEVFADVAKITAVE